jgi:hypothetical protein
MRGTHEHDLNIRVECVRAIAEGNSGRVISREDNVMTIEIPADAAPGLASVWGEGGFSVVFIGQRRRLSHCRIIDMTGRTIVRHQAVVTAFYRYSVDLNIDTLG